MEDPKLLHEDKQLNPWFPETDPMMLIHLGKFLEEVNELGAAIARCIIQGVNESEPVTGKPNMQWLEDEIADVSASGALVTEYLELRTKRINERYDRKMAHLREWHKLVRGGKD